MVVVAPKNLLRNKRAVSSVEEMGPGTMFHRVFDETDENIRSKPDKVKVSSLRFGGVLYLVNPSHLLFVSAASLLPQDLGVLHWTNLLRIAYRAREAGP